LRTADGETVRLRPKSFDMLQFFAANAGRVIGKQELIDAIWPNIHVGEDSLFQCIRDIRAALGDDERQLVKSVSGRGYIFDAEVSLEPGESDVPGERADSAALGLKELPAAEEPDREQQPLVEGPDSLSAGGGAHRPPLLGPGWQFRLAMAAVTLGAVIGVAILALVVRPASIFALPRPIVSVMPIAAASDAPDVARVAADLTERLSDGLSKIGNIRVSSPNGSAERASAESAGREEPRFVVAGQLQRHAGSWEVQAHMADAATGELLWAASFTVGSEEGDALLQQYRLAGGVGYGLALRLNKILNVDPAGRSSGSPDDTDDNPAYVIEQANAFINRTTPERFQAAEKMLAEALAAHPDDVDLEVALASHRLRGVQTRWYSEAELAEKEANIKSMLQAALRAKPTYLPALEGYCRLLTATNNFVEGLVACARTLGFNPWNGTALFEMGLSQIQLARFDDALASFVEADRFDTPRASRWTWLLGAGFACLTLDRNEEALSWLARSIAITPGTGRSHLLLAAAYQRLGRTEEAKLALAKALQINPKFTAQNAPLPKERANPAFLEAGDRIMQVLVELGLPKG
jgi:DNA-binding winged helix-turn-helix (wHTH) protein/tetratricopeptide (TPR) repeat protein